MKKFEQKQSISSVQEIKKRKKERKTNERKKERKKLITKLTDKFVGKHSSRESMYCSFKEVFIKVKTF